MAGFKSLGEDLTSSRYITDEALIDRYIGDGLWTWGWSGGGALGDAGATRSSPVQVAITDNTWKQVTCGYYLASAIKLDGSLWTWGHGGYGGLGNNGALSNIASPIQTICSGTNWKQVGSSRHALHAIKTDGTLWSWGKNDQGQLGNGVDVTNRSSPVQTICSGANWKQVSGSIATANAIKTDGTMWGWGLNQYGQIGDGTNGIKSSPVQVTGGGTNWKQVSAGGYHTAAIRTDGTLCVWGQNDYGPLGDNTVTHRSSPVQTVAGGTNWKSVSAGRFHTIGIKNDGTLWIWGYNNYGQLGTTDATSTNRSSPVQTICSGSNWKQVGAGYYHNAAIKSDGTMWTWGRNAQGELGDGTTVHKSSPVQVIGNRNNWKQVDCGQEVVIAVTNGA